MKRPAKDLESAGMVINHLPYAAQDNGIRFGIRVQPRSARLAVTGIREGRLKINLTAPPADNAANKQCIALLARIFDKKKNEVNILSGLKSRTKTVFINELDPATFRARLKSLTGRDEHK